jgi:hypothetical protein
MDDGSMDDGSMDDGSMDTWQNLPGDSVRWWANLAMFSGRSV